MTGSCVAQSQWYFFSLFFSVICFEVLNISSNQFLVIQTRDILKFIMTLFMICWHMHIIFSPGNCIHVESMQILCSRPVLSLFEARLNICCSGLFLAVASSTLVIIHHQSTFTGGMFVITFFPGCPLSGLQEPVYKSSQLFSVLVSIST